MANRSRYKCALCVLFLISLLVGFPFHHRQTVVAQQSWSLPVPWSAQDIGNPAIPGSAVFDQGTFSIDASGDDIGGQSDQFTFIYQQVTGDVDVIALVNSVSATDAGSETGVMIRNSLAADAAHGYALVSAGSGVAFQRRRSDGGPSSSTTGPSVSAPYWVRLVRQGTDVTAYSSADGSNWSTLTSKTVTLGSTVYVGIATNSHNASAITSAVVSQVSVNQQTQQSQQSKPSLPAPQQAADIGAPAIAGSTSYSQGVYSIHAGGADIWGTSDQFHFVYQPMAGDGEVIAHVQSLTNSDPWAKTGVMIRETLAADSRHALTAVTAGQGYAFQRRIDPGGISQHTAGPAGSAPGWVRLVRTASRFDAYQSSNGTTWTLIGSDTIPMADAVYVGIATTSHNTTTATDAVLDNFSYKVGTTSNLPPQVAITSPATGTIYTAGNNVVVSAAATDTDGTISRVDFFAGSTLIGSDTTAPYSVTWSSVPAGTYVLTAAAIDNDGASATSAGISIRVDPVAGNQPPTVSLTAPANGATFTAPASVSLTASAADADGTIAKVEFYNGSTLLNADTTSPYSYTWSSVAAGSYVLKAIAYDNSGARTTSATSTITVGSGGAATTVPSPWTATDIGSPALAGSSSYSAGVFSVDAGGADIWGYSDQFQFIYQPIAGDVDIAARVDSLTAVDPYTNAGVMIRDTLQAGSVHGYSTVTGSNGVDFRSRPTTNGISNLSQGPERTAPTWVRLVRQGTLVTSYWSTDGNSWSVIGTQTLAFGTTAYVGLAVCSHNTTSRTTARFSNVRVVLPAGNQPPTATLTAPSNGATFTAPASITLSASASDANGTIAKVEFYNGTTLLNTDTAAPYTFNWLSVAAGTYALKAIAYDNNGASASSATSSITVSTVVTTPPTGVAFTASPDHATMVTSYELRIYASGADPYTATPIAKSNLGKPTPDATNTITVDQSAFLSALGVGNYVAAVAAIGSAGSSISTGVTFTR